MLHDLVNLGAVLIAAALLGVEVWVVGIVTLGHLVARPTLGPRAVARALLALVISAAAYVTVVILIVALVSP